MVSLYVGGTKSGRIYKPAEREWIFNYAICLSHSAELLIRTAEWPISAIAVSGDVCALSSIYISHYNGQIIVALCSYNFAMFYCNLITDNRDNGDEIKSVSHRPAKRTSNSGKLNLDFVITDILAAVGWTVTYILENYRKVI